jgi:hypothetical protein
MATLLIKMADGTIYSGKYPLHAIMADAMGLPFDEIVNVGFITKNREVWCNRKPH